MNVDKELHRVTVTAIIYKDGKYLITKRSEKKKVFPGKWTVPGGGISTDDYINTPTSHAGSGPQWYFPLIEALRREVKEEVGLEIGEPKYLLDLTFIRPDGIPVLNLSYYAPYVGGEVTLSPEDVDHKWVTLDEAKSYDLIDGIWEEIKMVDEILKK